MSTRTAFWTLYVAGYYLTMTVLVLGAYLLACFLSGLTPVWWGALSVVVFTIVADLLRAYIRLRRRGEKAH